VTVEPFAEPPSDGKADVETEIGSDLNGPLERVLKQCGDDLSRKNIVKQAKSLSHVVLPTAFPGVEVNTSGSSNMIWSQMQLQRWSGSSWEPFGGVLDASSE